MSANKRVAVRKGRLQTGASVALAVAIVGVIAVPSWTESQTAGRMAIFGAVVFAIAVAVGSARLVGLSALPILGAALITTAATDDPAWVRSIVVGILWYLAAEMAWEGISRRDGVHRSTAFNDRRIDEITTVVMLSLAVTSAAFLTSQLTPVRTILAVGLVLFGLIAGLHLATRHLNRSLGVSDAGGTPDEAGRART